MPTPPIGDKSREKGMEEYEVDLRDYLRVLWRRKWIVLATFLVAVGGGGGGVL